MIIHGAPNKKIIFGKKKVLKNNSQNSNTNNENNSISNKNPENFSIESSKINYLSEGINNSNLNDQQTKISREFETIENKGKFTIIKENNPKIINENKFLADKIKKPTTSGDEGLDHPIPLMSDYDEIRAQKYQNQLKEEAKKNYIDDEDLEDPENKEIYLRVIEKFNKNILPLNNKKQVIEIKKNNSINININNIANPNVNNNKRNSKLETANKPKINDNNYNENQIKYVKGDSKISPNKKIIPTNNNQIHQSSYPKPNYKESQKKYNEAKTTPVKIPTNNVAKISYNGSNSKRETPNVEKELGYKRQTVERGGKYNNIQTTYIVYSKKNCDIHLTKNFSLKRIETINQLNKIHHNEYQNLKGRVSTINNNSRAGYSNFTVDKKNINNRGYGGYEGIYDNEINRDRGNKNSYSSYSYNTKLNRPRNDNNTRVVSINMNNNNQRNGQYQNMTNIHNNNYRYYGKGQDYSKSEKSMILPNRYVPQNRYNDGRK